MKSFIHYERFEILIAIWKTIPGAYKKYFSEGAKSFFLIFFQGVKCFFPVENSHCGKPKTNFNGFEKWKAKKKKTTKKQTNKQTNKQKNKTKQNKTKQTNKKRNKTKNTKQKHKTKQQHKTKQTKKPKKTKNKNKKQNKTEKILSRFFNFSSFHFQFSTFPFSIFLLFLSISPCFFPSLFPVGQQKFPGEKCQRALAPAVAPLDDIRTGRNNQPTKLSVHIVSV